MSMSTRRNPRRISEFEGGYPLPSGKSLTEEIAKKIGREAGLNVDNWESLQIEKIPEYNESGECCGHDIKFSNPTYIPFIDTKEPLPPMLQFIPNTPYGSAYTINLNNLKPTRNSPNQTTISNEILKLIK